MNFYDNEIEHCRKIINFAQGSVRFKGIILPDEIIEINNLYISGEIDKKEHTQRCLNFAATI